MVSVTSAQYCHFSRKAPLDNTLMKTHGCIPILFYLRTLKFEFYIILIGHNIFFFFWLFFPKPFTNAETILGSWTMYPGQQARFGLWGIVHPCCRYKTSTSPLSLGKFRFLLHPLEIQSELHWELQGSLKSLGREKSLWHWAFKRRYLLCLEAAAKGRAS